LLLGENYSGPTSTLLEEKYLHIPRAEEIKKRAYQAIVRPNVDCIYKCNAMFVHF
jgi:hypothetical protein